MCHNNIHIIIPQIDWILFTTMEMNKKIDNNVSNTIIIILSKKKNGDSKFMCL